jgi:hypothetical protein
MTYQSFGAFLQCYKNEYATYKCLESFRQFYPHSTIVLLSDNGYNYSEMAKHFNCIYIHEYENISLLHRNLDDGSHITHSYKLIERIKNAFKLITEDYIMWLEDDVSVNGIIKDTFKYDLNGYSPNHIYIHELQKKYTFLNNTIYKYNGHGGSIINKEKILNCFDNNDIIEDVLINWKKYNLTKDIFHDYFFSLLITLNKGTVGTYIGHADCIGYKNDNIIVQHQYKCWYNHPMPESLKYLVLY